jgi:ribonuclease HII
MALALAGLSAAPQHLLIDALCLPDVPLPQIALIKGDRYCLSIAAASIIAKVSRDHLMVALDRAVPGYGLAQHKGYGTAVHRRALEDLGASRCHRLSFAPLRALGEGSPAAGMPEQELAEACHG